MSEELQTQAPAVTGSLEGIKPGLEARSDAMQAVAEAHESLGAVASHPIVRASGEVVTPRDQAEELRMRQVQGHGFQH